MKYLLAAILLWPWLRLLRWLRPCRPGRRLVIQTAKIGDWINSTPVFRGLAPVDVVCDAANVPLARHDRHIKRVWVVAPRSSIGARVALGWRLFREGYEAIHVLMPNTPNVFLARLACGETTRVLRTYRTSRLVRLLGLGFLWHEHGREDLTIDSYLTLAGLTVTDAARAKHATAPLHVPTRPCIEPNPSFRVGVSLSAGNRLKTLPMDLWERLLGMLAQYAPSVYVLGLNDDKPLLEELQSRVAGRSVTIVDCLGRLSLEELPWHIAQMHLYISSDTGTSYIADSLGVPLVNFAGPCHMAEQRPLGPHALVIETPGLKPFSYVFAAPYKSPVPPDVLYAVGERDVERLKDLMAEAYGRAQARRWLGSGIRP